MQRGADRLREGHDGPVKVLTSCPSCLQGLSRYDGDAGTSADCIVVEMTRHLLGPHGSRLTCGRRTRAASSASWS